MISSALPVRDQVDDVRRVLLAVAVDAAVALFQGDQRPGDVEVDEVVAEEVQVHAFAGHVGGQQDSHGGVLLAEVLDDLHLLGVGQAGVEEPPGAVLELVAGDEEVPQHFEGADALGEDDDPPLALAVPADGVEVAAQFLELGRTRRRRRTQAGP